MKTALFLSLLSSFLAWSSDAHAWGKVGHAAIAWVASQHLSAEAQTQVTSILGGSPAQTMPAVASWADEILTDPTWKSTWPYHFADLVDPNDYYHTPIRADGDAVQALIHYQDALADAKSTSAEKASALKFLIHIVGDIHQPLHSGKREDRGGNLINVTWFGQPIDLHHIWDNSLIAKFSEDSQIPQTDLAQQSAAIGALADEQFPIRPFVKDRTNFVDWTHESHALNSIAYAIGDGKLGMAYYTRSISPVNQRISIAGQRLARTLNQIFSGTALTEHDQAMRLKVRALCRDACVLK